MRAIWKYKLDIVDEQQIKMPRGAILLSAINQREELMLYVVVDTEEGIPLETRKISVYGTGHSIRLTKFIGTVSFQDGRYVFHVFADIA